MSSFYTFGRNIICFICPSVRQHDCIFDGFMDFVDVRWRKGDCRKQNIERKILSGDRRVMFVLILVNLLTKDNAHPVVNSYFPLQY